MQGPLSTSHKFSPTKRKGTDAQIKGYTTLKAPLSTSYKFSPTKRIGSNTQPKSNSDRKEGGEIRKRDKTEKCESGKDRREER